jgi:uncharacterized protein YbjT (DUF2867 family)
MKEKILITLATGKTGYAATLQLLQEGYPVRIYVRSRNAKAIELEQQGAEIAIGEFNNPDQITNALQGITKVYYNYPIAPGMPESVELFIRAATRCGVEAVVFMGQRIAEFGDTGSALTADVRTSYELFKASGLNVVYFVPGYFADNAFWVSEFVFQLGIMANPFGGGQNPWISNGDMGRVIVSLLKNPEPYYGQKIFPTGPKSISAIEMAAIFRKVSGRKIVKINVPAWLFFKAGIMLGKLMGYDSYAIVQAMFYNKQMQLNRFDIAPTDIVKKLTGREPQDFETITRQYFDNSPHQHRSFSGWYSALKKFMLMPLTQVPSKKEVIALNYHS